MDEVAQESLVKLKIDGVEVSVPQGTNLIEAARKASIEIPHYCYHKMLSIAGNCRMCQMEIKGQPKLVIACNTTVQEGMEVSTHNTSKAVADAQAAVLEFLLVNHPLDCTVCDQSGHCKLQDYHFQYSAKFSRFREDKEEKVKAVPLGPHVMLDGERCIMCTRCIRFCDEITKTSELGMINRGDRSVIAVNPGRSLDNPFSGTVCDLCPVGALTHRDWRFKTRIWFTTRTDSLCPGCSTGCNVHVASRQGEVVMVKGRMNEQVNKEWLCDEGRYGFHRFLPEQRVTHATVDSMPVAFDEALSSILPIVSGYTGVFVSAALMVEEYELIRRFFTRYHKGHFNLVLGYRQRALSSLESILISPDYAPNYRGAVFAGLVDEPLETRYLEALDKLRRGVFRNVIIIGDRGIFRSDIDDKTILAVSRAAYSVGFMTDGDTRLRSALKVILPCRSILEKSGLLMNRGGRMQYFNQIMEAPRGAESHWKVLNMLAEKCGGRIANAATDRDLTLWYLESERRMGGVQIKDIRNGGVDVAGASGESRSNGD